MALRPWLLALLTGCSAPARPGDATLLVGRPADALGLDPARVSDAESAEVCEQIYDHLVRYRPGSPHLEPALAERWDVSRDGTEWVFHLRRGVRFHDGTDLDADAVLFNLDRLRDPRHPWHRADMASYEPAFRNIVRTEKVDRHTVRVVIERAYAPFLANLSMFVVGIVSPTAVKKWGDDYPLHPVGTGPFRFVEWTRGERIRLATNPDWWGGAPRLKNLVFAAIADPRQRLAALESGAIDVAERLAPDDLQFAALHPELRIERVPGDNVAYLAMNTLRPPLDDARVRFAIHHAVNKRPIIRLLYQGLAVPAHGALAPSSWGHVALEEPAYDPVRARALLAAARFRASRPLQLFVSSTPRAYLPSPERVARIIARNLADVGVPVEVVVAPMEAHIRRTQAGDHDLCLLGWSGDNGDPDNFLYTLFDPDNAQPGTARNLAFFRDAQVHGLLRWAQETRDRAQRLDFYTRAQRLIAAQAPWVPIAHAEVVVARRLDVAGLVVPPSSLLHFAGVTRERPR